MNDYETDVKATREPDRSDESRLRAQLEAAQKFKQWVHGFLDACGCPADPDPRHTAETGCRISGRMRWLLAFKERVAELEAACRDLVESANNYRKCHDSHAISQYIRENGRHPGERRSSPWGELVDDAARAAALLATAATAKCETCNGGGTLCRCRRCGHTYRHIHKYSDCGNASCEGERSDDVKCEDCGGTGKTAATA